MALIDYVTGYQHVGVPTKDIEATTKFYEALGFQMIYETENNGTVRFFSGKGILIETYEKDVVSGFRGAIDHIALATDDIETVIKEANASGFTIVEGPCELPFWEKGAKYICIQGPNAAIVEFLQKY